MKLILLQSQHAARYYLCLVLFGLLPLTSFSQQKVIINMAPIDGVQLTPDNIFNYQLQSSVAGDFVIKGVIRYRTNNLNLSYTFRYSIKPGRNTMSADLVHPQWQFSSSALQELFFQHKVLPAGTYEYCVTVTPANVVRENNEDVSTECLFHRSDEFFLINLIDPSDKARLVEYNPVLTWVANYSFSSELTYRLRIAEMKQGQNAINAAIRNQPLYDERNLMQNSLVYPVYAKPLVANQWYAWTVDAYYKNILLGGSEAWQFIIIDSLPKKATTNRSYIDIKRESGLNKLTAVGNLKLKYLLDEAAKDNLSLEITDDKGKTCSFSPSKLTAAYGDNRYTLDFVESSNLKHNEVYTLKIKTETGHEYQLMFQYVNPDLMH